MDSDGSCLGVCYSGKALYYAVSTPNTQSRLKRIGCYNYNFDVGKSIIAGNSKNFPAVKSALEQVAEKFDCKSVRILSSAADECWTNVPRSTYEVSTERESYLNLLMQGIGRQQLETTWFDLSNIEYKLLQVRNRPAMMGLQHLLGSFSSTEYVADFEIGEDWKRYTSTSGAYLMLHCEANYLSATSYVLDKLRGCTYLTFDTIDDLPYLWQLYTRRNSWMEGIYDTIYLYGGLAQETESIMSAQWSKNGEIMLMNSLDKMKVNAEEETYGFRLESAFPAVVMSASAQIEEGKS